MIMGSFKKRGSPEPEATLRRGAVVFRFLGLIWMTLLVIVTLSTNPPPRLWIVYGSVTLAVVWTFLTWYMSRRHPSNLQGTGWFLLDPWRCSP